MIFSPSAKVNASRLKFHILDTSGRLDRARRQAAPTVIWSPHALAGVGARRTVMHVLSSK